jgi:hypothetical protein
MTANIRTSTRMTENAILLAGILMILGPGALILLNIQLTEQFFGARDILAQSPIGEITQPRKVVRKKGEEDSAYLKARQGDPVFEGDTVLTGKESSTRVTLSDGTVLELGPESMIRIDPVRSFSFKGIQKKFEVTVETGAIKAKAKSNSAPVVLKSSAGSVLKEIAPVSVVKKKTPGFLPNLARNLPIPFVSAPRTVSPVATEKPAGSSLPAQKAPAGTAPVPAPSLPTTTAAQEPPPGIEEEFEVEEAVVSVPAPAAPPVSAPVNPPVSAPVGAPATGVKAPVPTAMSKLPGVSERDLIPDTEELMDVPLEVEEKPILSKPVLAMAPKPKPLPLPAMPLPALPSLPPVAVASPTPTPVVIATPAAPPVALPVATPTPTPAPAPIVKATPIPRETEIQTLPAKVKENVFQLVWKDKRKNPKAQYKVSVVHGGRTSNIIASETETTWTLPPKKEGTMDWFVEGLNDDGSFSKSNVRTESWKIATVISPDLVPEGSEILQDKIRLHWKDKRKSPTGPYKVSIIYAGKTDTVVSTENDALWPMPLVQSGKLEWFIEAPDAVEGFIKSRSLATSWKFKTPTLMFPKPDASLPEYFLKGDRHELLLTWAPLDTCKEYHLNVSLSPRFETLLYTKITARHFQRFSVERPGEYFWRVGCSYGEDFTVYSNPRRFRILALNRTKQESRQPAPAGAQGSRSQNTGASK